MTPHELDQHRGDLRLLAVAFGWKRFKQEVHHERDSCRSWTEEGFLSAQGHYLLRDSDLTEGLLAELVRIANSLRDEHAPTEKMPLRDRRTEGD